MGMYDTINGEQVKCFPWVSLYHDGISYHGGDLKYYEIGSEVPYRRPHYNYGKNFVILDLDRFPESDYSDYDYVLHVIEDGKVVATYTDEIGNINWKENQNVVSYSGELLNIHSSDELLKYMKAQREYWNKREEIRSHWNELFNESMKYFTGIGLLEKDSEEKKIRLAKIEEIQTLMREEEKRIEPEMNTLNKEHLKWFADTSDIDDLIRLGDYISAYYTELRAERDSARTCSDMIGKLLNEDDTLYDRYIKWQGIDENVKEFKQS